MSKKNLGKKERAILQSTKAKPVYVTGVIFLFAITLAILFGGNIFRQVSMITAFSWLLAGFFTVAAFVCAHQGRGCYFLTKSRIIYEEPRGKERWELQLGEIDDCRQKRLLYSQVFKCYKILLKIKRKDGESGIINIGPFPMHIADQWEKEVNKQIIKRN